MKFSYPKHFYKVLVFNPQNRRKDDIITIGMQRLPGGLVEGSRQIDIQSFFNDRLRVIWDENTQKMLDAFLDKTIVTEKVIQKVI